MKFEELFFFSQPNQPVQEKKKKSANAPVVDHRSVDDLLTFINGQKMEEERLRTNSKAQKRARQKQKKVSVTKIFPAREKANVCHRLFIIGTRERETSDAHCRKCHSV